MSHRKPFNDRAGYVASLRNPTSGGWCVIYKANEAHLDPAGGNWVTCCEVHGTLCNHTNLPSARASMKSPDFCETCQQIDNHCRAESAAAWQINSPPAFPLREFRQQRPQWNLDDHLTAVVEHLEMIQKNLGDGEYKQIDTPEDARKFQRRIETVRIELCRVLADF